MPNVGEKDFSDKLLELHAASMDALVRGSAPARPYQPYPGDHPCVVCHAPYAPFGVGKPLRFWFCRVHAPEGTCPPRASLTNLTTSGSPNSANSATWPTIYGAPLGSPVSAGTNPASSATRSKSPSSPGQFSLW